MFITNVMVSFPLFKMEHRNICGENIALLVISNISLVFLRILKFDKNGIEHDLNSVIVLF